MTIALSGRYRIFAGTPSARIPIVGIVRGNTEPCQWFDDLIRRQDAHTHQLKSIEESWPAVVVGLVLLMAVWWWLLGHPAATIRRLAAPASAAATVPLFLLPFALTWGYGTLLLTAVIPPLAMLLLADGLAGLLPAAQRSDARMVLLAVALAALGGGLLLVQGGFGGPSAVIAAGLAAGVLIAPAALLYRQGRETPFNAAQSVIAPLELAALALTPAFALLVLAFRSTGLLWALVFWGAVLAAAERFRIAPLTRTVSKTRLQRDLVVEATEAERARIATDLHDVALQDLTMLAMRLDAKGDVESADAAREVAERVREICGELRVPSTPAASACLTCSSGPSRWEPCSTSGAGRRAEPTWPSSGAPHDPARDHR